MGENACIRGRQSISAGGDYKKGILIQWGTKWHERGVKKTHMNVFKTWLWMRMASGNSQACDQNTPAAGNTLDCSLLLEGGEGK